MCDHLPMSSYFEEHLLNIPKQSDLTSITSQTYIIQSILGSLSVCSLCCANPDSESTTLHLFNFFLRTALTIYNCSAIFSITSLNSSCSM